MPVTIKLFEATFTERSVTMPDECPHCDADLHKEGAMREWNWQDTGIPSRLTGDIHEGCIEADGTDCNRDGDDFYPFEVWCAQCDEVIADREGVVTPERLAAVRKALGRS